MGAGASTAVPPADERMDKAALQSFAGDQFDEAAFDKLATDGTVSAEDVAKSWRRGLLEGLFRACDDDQSGALSFAEFTQMLNGLDETTKGTFGTILFGQADGDKDGKLNVDEFVSFYLGQLTPLSNEDFLSVHEKLLVLAKSNVAIDKDAAVVEGYTADTKSTAEAAAGPSAAAPSSSLFISYASFKPDTPRFISYATFAPAAASAPDAAVAEAPWRVKLLTELFQACDKDGSAALSYAEFTAIFGKVDEQAKQRFGSILYAQADNDGDGKLSVDEFVSSQTKSFGALDDEGFKTLCEKLMAAASA